MSDSLPPQTVVMEIPEEPRAEAMFLNGAPRALLVLSGSERGSLERLRLAVSPDLKSSADRRRRRCVHNHGKGA